METSRKTTDELLELLKQKKSFDEYLQEGPEFVDMGLPQYLEEVMKIKGLKKADVIRSPSWTESMRTRYSPARESPTGISFLPLDLGWSCP